MTLPKPFQIVALAVLLAGCDGGDDRADWADRADSCTTARQLAAQEAVNIDYGFYTDFNPLSYAATQDSADAAFNRPLGYEPSLVAAVEAFAGGRLTFNRRGIGNPFAGIWLKAAEDGYDMVGGGITRLPERMRDADGREAVRFGIGHIGFRQSLLVRSDSAIEQRSELGGGHTVAVYRGTTGEGRLLASTGITDAEGYLRAGTLVVLEDGARLVAGGPGGPGDENAFRLTSAAASDAIATRVQLLPAGADRPLVRYYDDPAGMIAALLAGETDALAGGAIDNQLAAQQHPGQLRVTAVDDAATELGAFSYPATPAGDALREKLDAVIACLTDDGKIGFAEWLDSGGEIFARRAEAQRESP